MVNGINFNPFTGKVLTPEEIEKLDLNKNGIIEQSEFQEGLAWLSGGQDSEGEVDIAATDNKDIPKLDSRGLGIYETAKVNGNLKDIAQNREELQTELTKIEDEYIEQTLRYYQFNSQEKSQIVSFLKNKKSEFLNSYLQENPKGPYNMQAVAAEYISTMDEAIQTRASSLRSTNQRINNIKSAGDNFNSLINAVIDSGSYISNTEYQRIRDKAVEYLMGQLMKAENGNNNLFYAIDPNYKRNSNYITAKNAIKSLQNCTDPQKMQKFLDEATKALEKFIGVQNPDGTSKLTNGIKKLIGRDDPIRSEGNHHHRRHYNRHHSHHRLLFRPNIPHLSKQDRIAYYQRLNNFMSHFFNQYGDEKLNMSTQILIKTVRDAGSFIDFGESKDIIKSATNMFIESMFTGNNLEYLKSIYPGYKKDPRFIVAKKIMNNMRYSTHPQKDYQKIQSLITKMLKDIGANKIANGVRAENKRNVNISTRSVFKNQRINPNERFDIARSTRIENGRIRYTNHNLENTVKKIKNELFNRVRAQGCDIRKFEKCFKDAEAYAISKCSHQPNTPVVMFANTLITKFNEIMTARLHRH